MASTNCYKFNIHSYRFCVSYIGVSVSRVGPTRTAYSIFFGWAYYREITVFHMALNRKNALNFRILFCLCFW